MFNKDDVARIAIDVWGKTGKGQMEALKELNKLDDAKITKIFDDAVVRAKYISSPAYRKLAEYVKDLNVIEHILSGNVKSWKAGWWHWEPWAKEWTYIIEWTKSFPSERWIYEWKVVINGVPKTSNDWKSTFFPKDWSEETVLEYLNKAYVEIIKDKTKYLEPWTSNTFSFEVNWIKINMYLDNFNQIISSFPSL